MLQPYPKVYVYIHLCAWVFVYVCVERGGKAKKHDLWKGGLLALGTATPVNPDKKKTWIEAI